MIKHWPKGSLSPGLLLAVLSVFLLTACGPLSGGDEDGDLERGAGSSEASSPVSTAQEAGAQEPGETERPNFVLIVTDDMDVGAAKKLPRLQQLMGERGTTFENAFVTNSVCCPSRATILRGQYTHNHGVLRNSAPQGGLFRFRELDRERSTLATWLDDAGYRTALVGKYFNGAHTMPEHVPVGWDEWYEWVGTYNDPTIEMNENGQLKSYSPIFNHDTDLFSEKASGFLERASGGEQPFFLYLAPNSPHRPIRSAFRHRLSFRDAQAPRPPSFNEKDVSDKPKWVRKKHTLDGGNERYIDSLYRGRMRELLAVDDMLERLTEQLESSGELDNTYILFTSDNGYHLGQHRLFIGKWTAYEEDIRVPFIVRGPGVPEGRSLKHTVLNNDIAPTIASLAGVKAPSYVDGRSLIPLLKETSPAISRWRSAFLVEAVSDVLVGRPPYKAVRTRDRLYVEYDTGERELYNLRKDPYQLDNTYENAPPLLLQRLKARLEALKGCVREQCRKAENQMPSKAMGSSSRNRNPEKQTDLKGESR